MGKRKLGYIELEDMISYAHDRNFLAGLVQIATDLWRSKDLSDYAYSGLLQKASNKVISL